MNSFSIDKVKEVDADFYKFLRDSTEYMLNYNNLLVGLKDLNQNHKSKRVVFINSKCSNKGFVCVNCKNNEFEKILKTIENTIDLHQYRMKESKKILAEFKK
jgi:hypothetical protein